MMINTLPDNPDDDVEALLTRTLYETESESGWYGQPECADVARILAPVVRDRIAAAEQQARADALAEAVEALQNVAYTTKDGYPGALIDRKEALYSVERLAREGGTP